MDRIIGKEESEDHQFKLEEIKKLEKTHFKYHNRLNLTDHFNNHPNPRYKGNNGVAKDIADKMNESGRYTREVEGLETYWVVKNVRKGLAERNPFLDKVRTGFITFLFSIGAAILLYYILPPRTNQDSNQQNQRLTRLSDSLKTLHTNLKALEDTVAKYKR